MVTMWVYLNNKGVDMIKSKYVFVDHTLEIELEVDGLPKTHHNFDMLMSELQRAQDIALSEVIDLFSQTKKAFLKEFYSRR